MKGFLSVLRFELTNYFKNKGYLITTGIIAVVLIVGLSLPSFFDMSGLFGGNDKKAESSESVSDEEKKNFIIFDKENIIKDVKGLENVFIGSSWKVATNEQEVKDAVNNEEAEAGFILNSPTSYKYIVQNSSFSDGNQQMFDSYLSRLNRESYLSNKGIDVNEIDALYNTQINSEVELLGKDTVSNFAYTYGLIFVLYFMIIYYGQLIAVSVTTEKSNRAMEILVTSTSSNALIFGKVIAATIASLAQVGVILASALVTYKFNSAAWGGKLDFIFNISGETLATFAIFGLLGYLFYAFIFGSLGALVSKTEDIGKSASPVTMIFVVVFMAVMFGLNNPESMLMNILSYVPFSSCMAMFVRVAMGSVKTIEVVISLVILAVSTGFVGVLGAKIYRMGTLRYGNPVKLTNALKSLRKDG
ncbi:ABC transporter permease [Clostridium paraputrificum]|uniref:ABC-2 family transporter protein n=1 Tax=Clostridium paraputrificum TaxID=29363 RepID=A0A6N2ZHV4_9CLOT